MTEVPHGGKDEDAIADLFRRISEGDLRLDSPEVRERTRTDPRLLAELTALLHLDDELHATKPPADLPGADAPEPWSGADAAVTAAVRRHFEPPAPRRRWLAPALAGAALLAATIAVALAFGWFGGSGDRPGVADPDQHLGDEPLWPVGDVTREELASRGLDWTALTGLPTTATFRVELRTAAGRSWRSPDLRDRHWSPPPEDFAALSGPFEWRLEAMSPGREPQRWTRRASVR